MRNCLVQRTVWGLQIYPLLSSLTSNFPEPVSSSREDVNSAHSILTLFQALVLTKYLWSLILRTTMSFLVSWLCFYKWENWGIQVLSNMPNITQLATATLGLNRIFNGIFNRIVNRLFNGIIYVKCLTYRLSIKLSQQQQPHWDWIGYSIGYSMG